MTTLIDLEKLRTRAELRERRRDAREAAKARRRAEKAEQRRQEAAERAEAVATARSARVERRRARVAALLATARALRPVAPVALVTAFAVFGQIGYGFENYTAPGTAWVLRVLIAVGAAVTIESIANYVQWHAHDALLMGATATAARLRRASYLIAVLVAGVNYTHFADGWAPTPGAVVFGLFSASQPWLWGMHTRRAQQLQLMREGKVDATGAVFSAERWRAFPYRTWLARRYSIANGITDPRQAWEGSEADRLLRQAARAHARAARRSVRTEDAPSSRAGLRTYLLWLLRPGRTERRTDARTEPRPGERPVADPVPVVRTEQDAPPAQDTERPVASRPRRLEVVDTDRETDFLAWVAGELGGEKPSAYKVRQRYGCRQSVADRLLTLLDEPEAVAVG